MNKKQKYSLKNKEEIKLFRTKVVKAKDLKTMYSQEENIESEFLKSPGDNPFRTPEGYFDSMEDRIMSKVREPDKKKNSSGKIVRILKPVVGIAACLAVALILSKHATRNNFNSNASFASDPYSGMKYDSALNFSMIDESTLVNAIYSDEQSNVANINPDDMLAYISSGMNEVEIYSEIQN